MYAALSVFMIMLVSCDDDDNPVDDGDGGGGGGTTASEGTLEVSITGAFSPSTTTYNISNGNSTDGLFSMVATGEGTSISFNIVNPTLGDNVLDETSVITVSNDGSFYTVSSGLVEITEMSATAVKGNFDGLSAMSTTDTTMAIALNDGSFWFVKE
jgi:hypothetical protein